MSEEKRPVELFEEDGMTTRIDNDTTDASGSGFKMVVAEQLELDLGLVEQAVHKANAKQRAAALTRLIDALGYFSLSTLPGDVSTVLTHAVDVMPELKQAIIEAQSKGSGAIIRHGSV